MIVCAALWTQKFKEITSKIHLTPMRGGSIDLFDPKLEGLHQEAVHIFTCDLLFVSQSLLLIDFKFSS